MSALAGYSDALGFLQLRGFFVSFMSGNSTRFAVDMVRHSKDAALAAELISLFVVGVVFGSLVGRLGQERRRTAVIALVAALLGMGAIANTCALPNVAVIAMVLAMGAENATFEHQGDPQIGLTYMTGTLVKIGQRIAAALTGGVPRDWLPYLMLWLGLVGGAALGAFVFMRLGLAGLAIGFIFASIGAVISACIDGGSRVSL